MKRLLSKYIRQHRRAPLPKGGSSVYAALHRISVLLLTIICLAACDVHQWPDPNNEGVPDEVITPETKYAYLSLHLEYLTDMYYWEHTYNSRTGAVSAVSGSLDDYYDNIDNIIQGTRMEVTVKVHKDNSYRTLVSSESFIVYLEENFDTDVNIKIPAGADYVITVWSQLLDDNEESMYDNSDFNAIGLIRQKYTGNTDMRDAFRGRIYISVPDEGVLYENIVMKRPMGKMEFITTDLKDFFTSETKRLQGSNGTVNPRDYTVVISYPYYYPCSFTAMDDRVENALGGYSFSSPLVLNNADESGTSLGFDYVLINDTDNGAVQVQVALFYRDGTQVANTGMMTVPIKRDRHTVVRGNFLKSNNGGGIGIDPDFDGEFNIPM